MQTANAMLKGRPVIAATVPAAARLRYSAGDVLAMVWRERFTILLVFFLLAGLGVGAATQIKATYPAQSTLLIRLGQEYVYNPRVGDAARGAVADSDQVIQSETAILSSAALKSLVIKDIGLAKIYPKLGQGYAQVSIAEQHLRDGQAIKMMEKNLKIATAPDTSVVRVTFSHSDPQIAALVLNTLIDEYLKYRTSVLAAHDAGVLGDETKEFQSRLDSANATYEKFLKDNGISDFDAEKTALGQQYAQLLTDRFAVQAQLSEAEGRLGVTAREVVQTPAEIGLYRDVDHTAADKLVQLRLDRQDLLSRYKPDSDPVKNADRKIAELSAASGGVDISTAGGRRIGVNPVYQSLQTESNQLKAEAASLRAREAALTAQIAQVAARRQKFVELEPTYQDLARQRDVLSTNVRNFDAREQESQAQQSLAQKGDSNVRVVERAYVPTAGVSLKAPVAALAVLFAAFTAICIGLFRGFSRPGYPSANSASNALGLPVLASARLRTA
jgi:uncharacterized protein involved in exopolysaccharide biosynthesis